MISHKHIQWNDGPVVYGGMQNRPPRKHGSHKQREQDLELRILRNEDMLFK